MRPVFSPASDLALHAALGVLMLLALFLECIRANCPGAGQKQHFLAAK